MWSLNGFYVLCLIRALVCTYIMCLGDISFGIVLFRTIFFVYAHSSLLRIILLSSVCAYRSLPIFMGHKRLNFIQRLLWESFYANTSTHTHTHTREMISSLSHIARYHLLRICESLSRFFFSLRYHVWTFFPLLYGRDAQYYISLLFGINVLLNTCTRGVYVQIVVAVYSLFSHSCAVSIGLCKSNRVFV